MPTTTTAIKHDQVLHDRIVAPTDRLHQETRDTGDVEHRFRHDQPTHQERGFDADYRHYRQHGIGERVPIIDGAHCRTLGVRGADVVLAQNLEHGGTRQPHDERG